MVCREIYSRGYLPHVEVAGATQFVTWRLRDSLPKFLYMRWRAELEGKPSAQRRNELYSRIERHLDTGYGSQILRNPVAAHTVQEALIYWHGERYRLHAWSIMPTHVHCLISPFEGWALADVMKSLKSFTSRRVGERLGDSGGIWQRDFYDVLIKSPAHMHRTKKYIEWNPVKAGLCIEPKDWPYSSASPIAWEKVDRKPYGLA